MTLDACTKLWYIMIYDTKLVWVRLISSGSGLIRASHLNIHQYYTNKLMATVSWEEIYVKGYYNKG